MVRTFSRAAILAAIALSVLFAGCGSMGPVNGPATAVAPLEPVSPIPGLEIRTEVMNPEYDRPRSYLRFYLKNTTDQTIAGGMTLTFASGVLKLHINGSGGQTTVATINAKTGYVLQDIWYISYTFDRQEIVPVGGQYARTINIPAGATETVQATTEPASQPVGQVLLTYEAGYIGNGNNTGEVYRRPDGDYATWIGSSIKLNPPDSTSNIVGRGPSNEDASGPWCFFRGEQPFRPTQAGWYRFCALSNGAIGQWAWLLVIDQSKQDPVPAKPPIVEGKL